MAHKATTIGGLITEVANTHHIHDMEACDEVFDAIDILWAPEDRPQDTATTAQVQAIREYIATQYATNRTRL